MGGLLDTKKLSETTTPIGPKLDLSQEQRAAVSGIGNSVKVEQTTDPAENPAANLMSGPASTFISLTRNEKYKSEPNAGAIWICAGMSNSLKDKAPETKQGIKQQTKKNPNLDASFITLSAKSDVDDYLGLAQGSVGSPTATAAITIKSSDIRVVARSGIKLITGTDTINEKSGEYGSIKGIDIIAGNDDSNLQSMVKGENLVSFLREVMDVMSNIAGTVEILAKHQNDLNGEIKTHTHNTVGVGTGMVTMPPLPPLPVTTVVNGTAIVSPPVLAWGILTSTFISEIVLPNIGKHKRNIAHIARQYLAPTSDASSILSKYNKVN